MSSITFNGLKKIQTKSKNTFSDVHLDFANPVLRDISADYDSQAVINSIINLFNTIPGQNLLNPTYGLNLAQFLFYPANTVTANAIGQAIVGNVSIYEPRATVQNVSVNVISDANQINVTFSILIPSLNQTVTVPGTLTSAGFNLL